MFCQHAANGCNYPEGECNGACTTTKPHPEVTHTFQREDRYIVLKIKDLERLAPLLLSELTGCLSAIANLTTLPRRDYVVVESDWPEYETVWKMIEARVTGKSLATNGVARTASGKDADTAPLLAEDKPAESGEEAQGAAIGREAEWYTGVDRHGVRHFYHRTEVRPSEFSEPLYTKPQADKVGGEVVGRSESRPACSEGMCPNKAECDAAQSCLYTQPQPSALPDDVVKDAERYRWLRDRGDETWEPMAERVAGGAHGIDAAIDAAMLKEGE